MVRIIIEFSVENIFRWSMSASYDVTMRTHYETAKFSHFHGRSNDRDTA